MRTGDHRAMDVNKAALACFPRDYAESRRRFLKAAKAARAPLRSYPNPNKGPAGEALATDCAWIGPKIAPNVLVLLTATHGVEGFCGAGAVMDFFATRPRLPKNLAVLAIHAINPHGFAWIRRVTEEGVDLNRNFVDFAKPPENPGYEELRPFIVPAVLDGPEYDAAVAKILDYGQRHGQTAMNVAFSGGQYTDPKGVFFGGHGPTWSHRTHAAIIADYALTRVYGAELLNRLRAEGAAYAASVGQPADWFDRMLLCEPEFMGATLATLDQRYGGPLAYLRGIGVSAQQLERLRANLIAYD